MTFGKIPFSNTISLKSLKASSIILSLQRLSMMVLYVKISGLQFVCSISLSKATAVMLLPHLQSPLIIVLYVTTLGSQSFCLMSFLNSISASRILSSRTRPSKSALNMKTLGGIARLKQQPRSAKPSLVRYS
ncbi:hypothetical protein HanHA300_Chr03g0111841 [Helianthus annuus]|nr:hypothetical protein HanHA300_Chr03g0111841 [Helianthus annuus]KAJ0769875.1 hypothetical protein HanLR1_Chr03g0117401 [Helianthus annuus]